MTAHPIDTEALRRLADAATEGPWEHTGRNGIHTPIGSCIALTHRHDPEQRQDDAEFIAAARTAVPALLDLLARWERRSGGHIQVDVDEWCDENDMLHMDLQAAVARAEAAEHRATRAEAQSEARNISLDYWRHRAIEYAVRSDAAVAVLDRFTVPGRLTVEGEQQLLHQARRALAGNDHPPAA